MDGTEICRVCRGEGTPDHPLFYPCKCSGSMKYIHQDCLEEWLEHSHKKYCEICNYQFSFSPIYDESAPEKLSPLVFLKAMFKKTFTVDNVYFRIVFAMSFWLVWVPYATHWIWVFFENPSVFIYPGKTEAVIRFIYLAIHYQENEELFKETLRAILQRFSRDVFHGQVISVAAILVGLIVLCIKEYADFRRNRIVVNNDQPFQQVIQLEEQLIREQQLLDRQRQQLEQQQQQQRQLQEQQLRQQIHDFEMFLNNLDEANRLHNENPPENRNETTNNDEDNEFESENGNDNKTISSENDSTKLFEESKFKFVENDEATTSKNEVNVNKLNEETKDINSIEKDTATSNQNNNIIDDLNIEDINVTLLPKIPDIDNNISKIAEVESIIPNDKIINISLNALNDSTDPTSNNKGKENIELENDNKINEDYNTQDSLELSDVNNVINNINNVETDETANIKPILDTNTSSINPVSSQQESYEGKINDLVNTDEEDDNPAVHNTDDENENDQENNNQQNNNENNNEGNIPNINPINLNNIPFVINNRNNNVNNRVNFDDLFNNNNNNNDNNNNNNFNNNNINFNNINLNNINLNNINLNNNNINLNNNNANNNNNNNNGNNILFNNNINNANIIDNQQENNDGGIVFLELVGIQGPIENLFQNCFMILIIITGTIVVTIWLPSIIGKGGVWILTNILTPTAIWVFGVAMEAMEYLLIFFDNITSPILNPIADLLVYIVTLTSKFFNFGVEVSSIKSESVKETVVTSAVVEEPTLAPYNVSIPEILTEEEKAKLDDESNKNVNIINFSTYSFLNIFVGYFLIFFATYFYAKRNVYLFVYTQNFKNMIKNWMKYVLLSIKVVFFIFIELAIFPMFCGVLIVFCTLPILGPDSTIKSHYDFFINNIWISQFLYWLAGTSFMFQLALYVGTLKEILRPGALWFVSDPNDPQFQPIKEIIEKPVFYQLRKLFNSGLMYLALIFGSIGGTVVLLQIIGILWIYIFNHGNPYGIGMIWPLNYEYSNSAIQFPADLILYLLLVPFVVNVSNTKTFVKKAIEVWFRKVSHWLHISEYMFKGKFEDEESDDEDDGEEDILNEQASSNDVKKGDVFETEVDGNVNVNSNDNENDTSIVNDNDNEDSNIPPMTIENNKNETKSRRKHRRQHRRLRVPNTDRIKITPGEKILIPMNDGEPLFGREGETPEEVKTYWTIIYRANHFKLRIYTLLLLQWLSCIVLFSTLFALPLLLGRYVVKIIDTKYYSFNNYINPPTAQAIRPDLPLHDGQSMVIGILILLFIGFSSYCVNRFIDGNMKRTAKLCFVYIKLYIKEKVRKDKLKGMEVDKNDHKEAERKEEVKEEEEEEEEGQLPRLDEREEMINPDLMDNEETINLIKNEQVLPEPRVFLSVVFNWWSKLFKNTFDVVLKVSYISIVILFIVPILFGTILEGYIISTIRIPLHQSNVLVLSDIWSYGLVLLSIIVSVINIGPQTRYKTIFQEIRNGGFFNFSLKTLHKEVVAPTIKISVQLIIAPLIFAFIVAFVYCHFIVSGPNEYDYIRGFEIIRFSFISTLTASILIEFWFYFVDVCKKWMDSVKDEEYLIGRKLHNIEEVNENPAEVVENH